jgi:hypothetical protein
MPRGAGGVSRLASLAAIPSIPVLEIFPFSGMMAESRFRGRSLLEDTSVQPQS